MNNAPVKPSKPDKILLFCEISQKLFVCFWRETPLVGQGLLIHDVPRTHPKAHRSR